MAKAIPPLPGFRHGVPHGHCQPHSALGRVLAGKRIVEEDHEAIAGEVADGGAEVVHELTGNLVELGQDGHELLRLRRFGEDGGSAQVAEQDGDLATMALEDVLVRRRHDEVGQLR